MSGSKNQINKHCTIDAGKALHCKKVPNNIAPFEAPEEPTMSGSDAPANLQPKDEAEWSTVQKKSRRSNTTANNSHKKNCSKERSDKCPHGLLRNKVGGGKKCQLDQP